MAKPKQKPEEKQPKAETPRPRISFSRPLILLILVILAFAGLGTVAIMSDVSIHGLTVRFYAASRYCSSGTVTFSFGSVVVYSSNSLPVTLHLVSFAMSADGMVVATQPAGDSSFGPGQSTQYTNLVFANGALDPHSQPSASTIDLTINAQASAGLFSSQVSSSVSQVVNFGSPPC